MNGAAGLLCLQLRPPCRTDSLPAALRLPRAPQKASPRGSAPIRPSPGSSAAPRVAISHPSRLRQRSRRRASLGTSPAPAPPAKARPLVLQLPTPRTRNAWNSHFQRGNHEFSSFSVFEGYYGFIDCFFYPHCCSCFEAIYKYKVLLFFLIC